MMKRERKKFRDSFVAILLAISMVVGLVPVNSITVLVKLFGNTLFGNHALYRNSIGVI